MGIKITSHRFIGLSKDGSRLGKGVKATASDGDETFIPAEVVLDCSGTSRSVVHLLNDIHPSPLYREEPVISNVRLKKHVIVNAWAKASDLRKLDAVSRGVHFTPPTEVAAAKSWSRLATMGWQRATLPTFYYHKYQDKDGLVKVCFYSEVPDSLAEGQEKTWIELLLAVATGKDTCEVRPLKPSSKTPKKDAFRIQQFIVDPTRLVREVSQPIDTSLPIVLIVGDSEISADYRLSHGVSDGAQRAFQLVKLVIVENGAWVDCNEQDYQTAVKANIRYHQQRIIECHADYARFEKEFVKRLVSGLDTWREELIKAQDEPGPIEPRRRLLKEVTTRCGEMRAIHTFHQCMVRINTFFWPQRRIGFELMSQQPVIVQRAQEKLSNLLVILQGLPESYCKEKAIAVETGQRYLTNLKTIVVMFTRLLNPQLFKQAFSLLKDEMPANEFVQSYEQECRHPFFIKADLLDTKPTNEGWGTSYIHMLCQLLPIMAATPKELTAWLDIAMRFYQIGDYWSNIIELFESQFDGTKVLLPPETLSIVIKAYANLLCAGEGTSKERYQWSKCSRAIFATVKTHLREQDRHELEELMAEAKRHCSGHACTLL